MIRASLIVFFLTAAMLLAEAIELPHDLAPFERDMPLGRDFVPTDPPSGPVRPVAEWEPMRGAMIRWNGSLGLPWSLVVAMAEHDELVTLVSNAYQQTTAEAAYADHGVNLANCRWMIAATNTMWTRDYGPFFIMGDSLAVVDFIYNRPRPLDDAIPSAYALWDTLACYGMSIVHTGGNWMSDGAAAASTQLVWTENPGLTASEISAEIAAYTGAAPYHALNDPLGEYIEHIDCWGKFLAPDKVLIGRVEVSDPRFSDYEQIASYFASATSAWGAPYQVWRVNTPGDWPYTPYTNSLILNGRVFVPQTGHEYDDGALAVYEQAMPGYEIVGVDYASWYNTDALHCRVHELPDKRMLELRSPPLTGEQPMEDSLRVAAMIRAHSGAALLADSLCVFWRALPDTAWSSMPLQETASDSFFAMLPPVNTETTVEYWLRAVDASGRAAQQPVMGPQDPHTFAVASSQLSPPGNLRIDIFGDNVALTWDATPGATLYRVWSAENAEAEEWTLELETSERSAMITATEEKRFYRVTALR